MMILVPLLLLLHVTLAQDCLGSGTNDDQGNPCPDNPPCPPGCSPDVNPTPSPTDPAPSPTDPAPSPTPGGDGSSVSLAFPTILSSGSDTPSSWSATLTVEQHYFNNSQASFWSRAYCLNGVCANVGPTIELVPGDNFTLTLLNNLGPNPTGEDTTRNSMHSPNTTNLHTHGLHIDPATDTIFTLASPAGGSLSYEYQLPSNHAPGMHWYHSHVHGASSLQVMGGLVGALIVKPSAANDEHLPVSLLDADAHTIVLQQLTVDQAQDAGLVSQGCGNGIACDPVTQPPLCTQAQVDGLGNGGSPFSPFRVYSYQELSAATGSHMDASVTLEDTSIGDLMVFANGQFQPTLDMTVGSTATLNIVAAWGGNFLELNVAGCSMNIVAWDGVYHDAVNTPTVIYMLAGNRVTVQLTCDSAGTYSLKHRNNLVILNFDVRAPAGDATIHNVTTTGELGAIRRPYYLSSALGDTVDDFYSVHVSQGSRPIAQCGGSNLFWWGAGSDCSGVAPWGTAEPSSSSTTCPFGFFQGQRGTAAPAYELENKLVTRIGRVNEWAVYGLGRDKHPLHVHVHHMQIVSFEPDADDDSAADWQDWIKIGEWRDVLPTFQGKLVVRFRATDYPGETVMHCHFLRHEDLGMMDTFLVEPGTGDATPTWDPAWSPDGPTPTSGPSPSPTPTSGPSPSPTPTSGPSPSPTPTAGPSPSPTPTPGPSPTSGAGVQTPSFIGLLMTIWILW